jgi:transcriptional regulator with XRE-family HTH domain
MADFIPSLNVGQAVARLRAEAGVTQAALAAKSGLDQSRISRIEKGGVNSTPEVDRVFLALDALGVEQAKQFLSYAKREWRHIEPPSFWNPDRTSLELAESTLESVAQFVGQEDRPWPLRRQIEKHQESLIRAASFLGRLCPSSDGLRHFSPKR